MSFVLDILAKGSIILLSAAVLSAALRRASASTRHAVWILAIASASLLPLAAAVVPRFELPLVLRGSANVTFLPTEVAADARAGEQYTVQPSVINSFQLAAVWLVGFACLFLRFIVGAATLRRVAHSASGIEDETWTALLNELMTALEIQKPLRLL